MSSQESDNGLKALENLLKTYPYLVKNIYSDGASGAIQEIGGITTDLLRGARLVTAPIQYMAHLQGRLEKYLKNVSEDISKKDQITPSSSILLPILEKLKYQNEDEFLSSMYVELLKRACDKNRVNEAHPAFINIIPQLSTDEAIMIFHLSSGGRNNGKYFLSGNRGSLNRLMDYRNINNVHQPSSIKKGFTFNSSAVVKNIFPLESLAESSYLNMYISHLKSLNLIQLRNSPGIISFHMNEIDRVSGKLSKRDLVWYDLTLFGELFSKACIPEDFDFNGVANVTT